MRLLLDTHALIWFLNGDKQLPEKSIALIRDLRNSCHISIASIWEIAIKLPFDRIIISQGIVEGFHIVTKDEYFKKYDVKIIWD
jgi:PIN domain nuclease of toxin-antitoxin system